MIQNENAQTIVDRAIERLNELLDPENAIAKQPETILLGPGGKLDSMGFVNLVVALEEELKSSLGLDLSLMDALYADQKWSERGLTVGGLAILLERLASEKHRANHP
jgi:acyl carrier protein